VEAAPVVAPVESTSAAEPPKDEVPKDERPRGPDGKFLPKDANDSKDTKDTKNPKDAPSTAVAPETYDLVLPKDAALTDASRERIAAIARARGLSNDAAQDVLNAANAEVRAALDAQAEAWKPGEGPEWKRRDDGWKADALKDPDIGGSPEKLAKSVELGQAALTRFGEAAMTEFLQTTGLGSHPAVIRLLAKIGKAMAEPTTAASGTPIGGAKSLAERMYPQGGETKRQSGVPA
jgi:hypothetical protein